jgi:hypothetical protein
MRDAFHDSAARWPPPRCYRGTRVDRILTITDWGLSVAEDVEPILWMHGPFGVGKSALAQTCTEIFVSKKKLAASVFFSHPNRRNDPDRVFTSIAYQVCARCPSLADIVDRAVQKEPTHLTASREIQFRELLVNPLREIGIKEMARLKGWIIVLDGLDECEGRNEQCEIIDIIATSVRHQTTPFRWFIASRPELHIQRSMSKEQIFPFLFHLDIPLSPETDDNIRNYLLSELDVIREQYGLSPSWYSEDNVTALIRIIAGLWVSAATIIRFVGDRNVAAPITQLKLVLTFGESVRRTVTSLANNPWAHIDLLYHFLLQRLPPTIVSRVRKILLLNRLYTPEQVYKSLELAHVLEISLEEFYSACGFLQSVLYLKQYEQHRHKLKIEFYHASFMEFMEDQRRSKDFWIYGDCLEELQQEVIELINIMHSHARGKCLCRSLLPGLTELQPQRRRLCM